MSGWASARLPEEADRSVTRRPRVVLVPTLVLGTALLAGALAVDADSAAFTAFGLLAALTWIAGALLAGPGPARNASGPSTAVLVGGAAALGVVAFGAFLLARFAAAELPVLAGSVERVLGQADEGDRLLVLGVALVNGLGEELLFRGALPAVFARRPALASTALYVAVTVATLNAALVVAAAVMGALLVTERRVTGGVLAPVVTHLTWSTLMLVALPR